ncbi:type-4 ice-structuring protein LS-12 [Amia ocellicauda]|uniref:type-4 ice-structuring protein LS-12 n=1 Tax=Amia ocellicauda TaxID=2972642 RepID=UPI003463A847|nr:AFP4 protein [Amia calva]
MKFSLFAAFVVVLALTHGSDASYLRDEPAKTDLETLTKYFQDLSALISSTTQDIVDKVKAQELADKAQAYLQDGKAQLQPLADNLQAQLKPLVDNLEEQLKPMADNLQAQVKPVTDNLQAQLVDFWQKILDQAKALAPPQ